MKTMYCHFLSQLDDIVDYVTLKLLYLQTSPPIQFSSLTLRHRPNFSRAPVKSLIRRQAKPMADQTPAGSMPHLVDTSIASCKRSSVISLSLNRLKKRNAIFSNMNFFLLKSHTILKIDQIKIPIKFVDILISQLELL